MIREIDYKKDGNKNATANFLYKEFIAKGKLRDLYEQGKYTKIILDDADMGLPQIIRSHYKVPVVITSGYRPPEYNISVNGAESSYHCKGQAFDIQVKGVHPVLVALYAYEIGIKGIGLYCYSNNSDIGFVHLDGRDSPYYWVSYKDNVSYRPVKEMLPLLKYGDTGYCVKILQRKLAINVDGIFGKSTEKTLFNKYNSREVTKDIWKRMFS